MAGRLVEDSVAAEAVLVPQIEPKPAPASAVAIPSPPGILPTQAAAVLNRSSATPDSSTRSAISRNIGMVISSYDVTAESGVVCSTPIRIGRPAVKNRVGPRGRALAR